MILLAFCVVVWCVWFSFVVIFSLSPFQTRPHACPFFQFIVCSNHFKQIKCSNECTQKKRTMDSRNVSCRYLITKCDVYRVCKFEGNANISIDRLHLTQFAGNQEGYTPQPNPRIFINHVLHCLHRIKKNSFGYFGSRCIFNTSA